MRLMHCQFLLCYAVTLSSLIFYKQRLKRGNQVFTLKQEFGNCPECPTIESKTIPITDSLRTFLFITVREQGLFEYLISNGPLFSGALSEQQS
jgi:hypothetical protein